MSEGRSLRHLAARSDSNCPKCKDTMKQLKIAREVIKSLRNTEKPLRNNKKSIFFFLKEIERLKIELTDNKNKMAEASKREEVLREENNFLKLPKAARRRKIDQDSRLKRKQIDKLKNVLHGQQGNLFLYL